MIRPVLAMIVAALLFAPLGCGGGLTIHTEVAAFHALPPTFAGATYAVIASQEQQGSLEFRSYEERVRAHLEKRGFRPVPLEDAELVVTINYAIDDGREIVSSYPVIGQTGVSSSRSTGTVQRYGSTATYSGTTTYTPSYGVVGSGISSSTVYARRLRIEIARMDVVAGLAIERVYECEAHSSGSSGHLSVVVPAMIEAVFQDFPGQSGNVRNVAVNAVPTVQEIRTEAPSTNQQRSSSTRAPECESAPIACSP